MSVTRPVMTEKYNESMNERSSRKMPTSVPTTKRKNGTISDSA